jgi:hypothetical protein
MVVGSRRRINSAGIWNVNILCIIKVCDAAAAFEYLDVVGVSRKTLQSTVSLGFVSFFRLCFCTRLLN